MRDCIVDGIFGIYVPYRFALLYPPAPPATSGYTVEQQKILLDGPLHDDYWETWEEVLSDFRVELKDGTECYIEQDMDVFLVSMDEVEKEDNYV